MTPWQTDTEFGQQANSFLYAGIKHFWSEKWGGSVGVFRGWEFFTATDEWSFKTTGIAVGVVYAIGIFEINPAINYSDMNTLLVASEKRIGFNLGLGLNLKRFDRRHAQRRNRGSNAHGQVLAELLRVLAEVLELAHSFAKALIELLGVCAYADYEVP